MKSNRLGWIVVISVLAIAGCGRNARLPADKGATAPPPAGASSSGADSGAASAGAGSAAADASANEAAVQPDNRIIYFDFDSSEIRAEFVDALATHARRLAGNSSIRVRLEGHTDERGSPEYNIGLGERRAQAVRRALMLQGVAESQLTTVSYGEERPAQAGSTEDAWAKNRRVELVYLN